MEVSVLLVICSNSSIHCRLVLVAKLRTEEAEGIFSDGGKTELLPYQGNIVFVKARVAALGGSSPELTGETPVPVESPCENVKVDDWVTLRVTVLLCLVEKAEKDKLLIDLSML